MWKHKNFINLQLCAAETWVLNETISLPTFSKTSIGFVSNGVTYLAISSSNIGMGPNKQSWLFYYYGDSITDKEVAWYYENGISTWNNQAYRTITFATPPTGDLLTWLQANGTKQSTPQPTLTFKHFYDAGTIGSGTVKFRHYSQQEPSSGKVIKAGTYQFIEVLTFPANIDIIEKITATINTLTEDDVYGSQKTSDTIFVYNGPTSQIGSFDISNEEPYYGIQYDWQYVDENGDTFFANTDSSKLRTIVIATDQTVSDELYKWLITDGNLVKLS